MPSNSVVANAFFMYCSCALLSSSALILFLLSVLCSSSSLSSVSLFLFADQQFLFVAVCSFLMIIDNFFSFTGVFGDSVVDFFGDDLVQAVEQEAEAETEAEDDDDDDDEQLLFSLEEEPDQCVYVDVDGDGVDAAIEAV